MTYNVTARNQYRNATGTFDCPACHKGVLVPGTMECLECHATLTWAAETYEIRKFWQERRRSVSHPVSPQKEMTRFS